MNPQLFHDLAASEESSGYPENARALRAVPGLVGLIEQLAAMNYDGEDDYIMENDDAVSTLSTMIQNARAALAAMDATEKGVEG